MTGDHHADLARRYLRRDGSEECHAAFADVARMTRDEPASVWQFVIAAVDVASSEADLDFLATGPLEDLLRWWSAEYEGDVEALARSDPRWIYMVRGARGPSADYIARRVAGAWAEPLHTLVVAALAGETGHS